MKQLDAKLLGKGCQLKVKNDEIVELQKTIEIEKVNL